jgi:hypothetical protein
MPNTYHVSPPGFKRDKQTGKYNFSPKPTPTSIISQLTSTPKSAALKTQKQAISISPGGDINTAMALTGSPLAPSISYAVRGHRLQILDRAAKKTRQMEEKKTK